MNIKINGVKKPCLRDIAYGDIFTIDDGKNELYVKTAMTVGAPLAGTVCISIRTGLRCVFSEIVRVRKVKKIEVTFEED